MNLKTIEKNLKLLAFGILFNFIGGLIYGVALVSAIMEAYIVFALAAFISIISGTIGLVYNLIFVFKVFKNK